jgi:hypothetical protein
MKTIAFAFALVATLSANAFAADWDAMKRNPARIEALSMQAVPLVAGNDKLGWARVPERLVKHEASVFMPARKHQGVADIQVTGDGYLLLACNYDYQGNASGNWKQDVWDERKFKSKGWLRISNKELGGALVKGDNREQILFVKHVRKGESFRLRCNKYDPPLPIALGAGSLSRFISADARN